MVDCILKPEAMQPVNILYIQNRKPNERGYGEHDADHLHRNIDRQLSTANHFVIVWLVRNPQELLSRFGDCLILFSFCDLLIFVLVLRINQLWLYGAMLRIGQLIWLETVAKHLIKHSFRAALLDLDIRGSDSYRLFSSFLRWSKINRLVVIIILKTRLWQGYRLLGYT